MAFLNKKHRIIDLTLTDHGRYSLARNQLRFASYAFSDELIDYSGSLSEAIQTSSSLDDIIFKNYIALEANQMQQTGTARDLDSFLYTASDSRDVLPILKVSVTGSVLLNRLYETVQLRKYLAKNLSTDQSSKDVVILAELDPVDVSDRENQYAAQQKLARMSNASPDTLTINLPQYEAINLPVAAQSVDAPTALAPTVSPQVSFNRLPIMVQSLTKLAVNIGVAVSQSMPVTGSASGSSSGSMSGSGTGSMSGSGTGSMTGSGTGSITGSGTGSLSANYYYVYQNGMRNGFVDFSQKFVDAETTVLGRNNAGTALQGTLDVYGFFRFRTSDNSTIPATSYNGIAVDIYSPQPQSVTVQLADGNFDSIGGLLVSLTGGLWQTVVVPYSSMTPIPLQTDAFANVLIYNIQNAAMQYPLTIGDTALLNISGASGAITASSTGSGISGGLYYIYKDGLANSWRDYSFPKTGSVDTVPGISGSGSALRATLGNFGAFNFNAYNDVPLQSNGFIGMQVDMYSSLPQTYLIELTDDSLNSIAYQSVTLTASKWQTVNLPFASMSQVPTAYSSFTNFAIFNGADYVMSASTTIANVALTINPNPAPFTLSLPSVDPNPAPATTGWLHVRGNQFRDLSGSIWAGQGVNIFDMRFDASAVNNDPLVTVTEMKRLVGWAAGQGVNFFRLLLESYTVGQSLMNNASYLTAMKDVVTYMASLGCWVTINAQIDPSLNPTIGGQPTIATTALMTQLAYSFKNSGHVMFGCCNEPRNNNTQASQDACRQAFEACVAAVRNAEFSCSAPYPHIVFCQGITSYARNVAYYVTNPVADPVYPNSSTSDGFVAYACHCYDHSGTFQSLFQTPSATIPINLEELGPATISSVLYQTIPESLSIMDYCTSNNIPYTGWALDPLADPAMLMSSSSPGSYNPGVTLQWNNWGLNFINKLRSQQGKSPVDSFGVPYGSATTSNISKSGSIPVVILSGAAAAGSGISYPGSLFYIYQNGMQNGWTDNSFSQTGTEGQTVSGSGFALSATLGAYGAFNFQTPLDVKYPVSSYYGVQFDIYASASQQYLICVDDDQYHIVGAQTVTITSSQWQTIRLPFATMDSVPLMTASFQNFLIFNSSPSAQARQTTVSNIALVMTGSAPTGSAPPVLPSTTLTYIYQNGIKNGWSDNSFSQTGTEGQAVSGSGFALTASLGAYGAFNFLSSVPRNVSSYGGVQFNIYASASQQYLVCIDDASFNIVGSQLVTITGSKWQTLTIPFATMSPVPPTTSSFSNVLVYNNSATPQSALTTISDLALTPPGSTAPSSATSSLVTIYDNGIKNGWNNNLFSQTNTGGEQLSGSVLVLTATLGAYGAYNFQSPGLALLPVKNYSAVQFSLFSTLPNTYTVCVDDANYNVIGSQDITITSSVWQTYTIPFSTMTVVPPGTASFCNLLLFNDTSTPQTVRTYMANCSLVSGGVGSSATGSSTGSSTGSLPAGTGSSYMYIFSSSGMQGNWTDNTFSNTGTEVFIASGSGQAIRATLGVYGAFNFSYNTTLPVKNYSAMRFDVFCSGAQSYTAYIDDVNLNILGQQYFTVQANKWQTVTLPFSTMDIVPPSTASFQNYLIYNSTSTAQTYPTIISNVCLVSASVSSSSTGSSSGSGLSLIYRNGFQSGWADNTFSNTGTGIQTSGPGGNDATINQATLGAYGAFGFITSDNSLRAINDYTAIQFDMYAATTQRYLLVISDDQLSYYMGQTAFTVTGSAWQTITIPFNTMNVPPPSYQLFQQICVFNNTNATQTSQTQIGNIGLVNNPSPPALTYTMPPIDSSPATTTSGWLHIRNKKFCDSTNAVWAGKGVCVWDMGFDSSALWEDPRTSVTELKRIIGWAAGQGVNFFRLMLQAQDSSSNYIINRIVTDANYLTALKDVVNYIGSLNCWVSINPQIDPSLAPAYGGSPTYGTATIMAKLAYAFKNSGHVMFGCTNEPRYNITSAQQDTCRKAFEACVSAVRAAEFSCSAPHPHIVICDGINNWSRDVAYYINNPVADPTYPTGSSLDSYVAYACHPYDHSGSWQAEFITPQASIPIFIEEFGPATINSVLEMTQPEALSMMNILSASNTPYTAWNLDPLADPAMLVPSSNPGSYNPGYQLQWNTWGLAFINRLRSQKGLAPVNATGTLA